MLHKTKYPHLFEPIRVGNTVLKNRLTTAPHYDFLCSYDNHLTRQSIEDFLPLSKGGASMVTMGYGIVNREIPEVGRCVPKLNDVFDIPSLSQWADSMTRYGAKASIELVPLPPHFGTHEALFNDDGIPMDFDINAMTREEMHELQQDYANAAKIAMMAGFDFVTVHGAHCNLPAMFNSKAYNKRTDEYGFQNMENRSRFARETLCAIREACGRHINIEYRLSGSDMTPGAPAIDEVAEFAHFIEEYVDLFLVSSGNLAVNKVLPYTEPSIYMEHGINIEYAGKIKQRVNKPVGVVGAVTFEQAEEAIASGKADTVAMVRQLIADPEAPNKAERGEEETIRPCIRCNVCISRPHFELKPPRCSVNPSAGREADCMYVPPVQKSKKVVVIGGGPGGLEAARTAAERGHKVVLMEKESALGGLLRGASAAPFKADMRKYLEWSIRETHKTPNVEVRLSCPATVESVEAENPDAVILAFGNQPIIPALTCTDPHRVVLGQDVESGKAMVRDNVLIVGAGLTGLEAALHLLQNGRKVTVIDMRKQEDLGKGGSLINAISLDNILEEYQFDLLPETRLIDVTEDDVIVERNGKQEHFKADTIILSLGNRVDYDKIQAFKQTAREYYVIGDANGRPGSVRNAVTSGYDAAMRL